MTRHKEKDDEAGGEGLGQLLTRKRLWRDSNGQIVAKRRPEHEKRRRSPISHKGDFSDTQHSFVDSSKAAPPSDQAAEPISPPRSLRDSVSTGGSDKTLVSESPKHHWPIVGDSNSPLQGTSVSVDSYDFLCNASWGSQPLQDQTSIGSDLPYDDIFVPDTGRVISCGN